jgi:ribosomal protein L11 methyltransferase
VGARFERIRVRAGSAEVAERASAEAFDAGASGLEEREEGGSDTVELWIYAPTAAAAAVWDALGEAAAREDPRALERLERQEVADEDWSARWREGLGIVRISARLAVRPPFVADDRAGSPALVVEPGQAFGTGGHASTRLALALLDGLGDDVLRGARVLDVGTGSGVLALAALAFGAASAVGFDLDPVAVREARANALRNQAGPRLRLFSGPIQALRAPPFDLVLANLLRTELLPILPAVVSALRPGGWAVLSGLLASEADEMELALTAAGLDVGERRDEADPSGERWLGLVTRRPAPPASRRPGRGG